MGVGEAAGAAQSQFAAALAAGIDTIGQKQDITFTQYNRVVLPLDGFVFWVRGEVLTPAALYGQLGYGRPPPYNGGPGIASSATTATVRGSLHRTSTNNQDMDEGFAVNQVIFTSESEIELLNTVNPTTMFVGTIDGQRFAFSKLNMLYRQAGLYHYQGDAVYPSVATQLIDFPAQLDSRLVVSNSLPIWLGLSRHCPMYPSYLIPDNLAPPYCAVHVVPESTESLQSAPWIDPASSSHWQLATEQVLLTFFGLRNETILDFQEYVSGFAEANPGLMGVMNSPVPRDMKRTQPELGVLAQKKTMQYEVNYYQQAVRAVAIQTINNAFVAEFFVELSINFTPFALNTGT